MNDIDWMQVAETAGKAALVILITWALATLVKWLIKKLVDKVPALQKQGADGQSIGKSLGTVGSSLVWLFGLVALLEVFSFTNVLTPVEGLLQDVMGYLPNLIGAGLLFFIGLVLARIVRQLVEAALGMVNFGGLLNKAKKVDAKVTGDGVTVEQDSVEVVNANSMQIAKVLANILFGIILLFVTIASLQVLGISAISQPAEQMVAVLLNAIPAIVAAGLLLAIGYFIAKIVGDILEGVLEGLAVDKTLAKVGLEPKDTTSSQIITRVVQVAIMVFFGVMAARVLDFPQVSQLLTEILNLGGRVVFGAAIIAAGFLITKIITTAMGEGTMTNIVRYATLGLFIAMGLQFMGIANSIITLAFGSIVVGAALAAALAFGLGGRDAAARTLNKLEKQE